MVMWLVGLVSAMAEQPLPPVRATCGDDESIIIDWKSAAELSDSERQRASIQMRDPNFSWIPGGGMVSVFVDGSTLSQIDPSNFTIVVRTNGIETGRYKGDELMTLEPEYMTSTGKWATLMWMPLIGIDIMKPMSIYVIDGPRSMRCEWLLEPAKRSLTFVAKVL